MFPENVSWSEIISSPATASFFVLLSSKGHSNLKMPFFVLIRTRGSPSLLNLPSNLQTSVVEMAMTENFHSQLMTKMTRIVDYGRLIQISLVKGSKSWFRFKIALFADFDTDKFLAIMRLNQCESVWKFWKTSFFCGYRVQKYGKRIDILTVSLVDYVFS